MKSKDISEIESEGGFCMVKVVITAPRGAMDSLIVQEAFKNENIEVVGCVGTPGRDYIGKDAGQICGLGQDIGALVYDSLEAETGSGMLIDLCDVQNRSQHGYAGKVRVPWEGLSLWHDRILRRAV